MGSVGGFEQGGDKIRLPFSTGLTTWLPGQRTGSLWAKVGAVAPRGGEDSGGGN